ncbi:transposase [Clostridium sp. Marseille-P2415]|uniref:transposase n=1 Tax=Clostridium sp. Marseille-P2415 TaxID=1805471 RepID=UPI000988357C|nr:transposase [Clostridium sp. Marseille-P2415]
MLVKKIVSTVDNFSPREQKRYQVICQIQTFLKEGCSYREIAKRMGISRRTVAKYRAGNPKELCESGINQSKLDVYKDEIIKCLHNGYSKSKTVKRLYSLGYRGAKSTAFDYLVKIERYKIQNFAPQPYVRTYTEGMKYKAGSKGKSADYITRAGIFQYLWMNDNQLTPEHKDYILKTYPMVWEILSCIRSFRNVFIRRSMPGLYLFIERYSNSAIPELKSFAKGLQRDIKAVENAVASDLSNGFVEGINSKLKMVKRTMYGRCSRKLLSAKMILRC